MEKIINVKVSGSEIEQSTYLGGIQGEGGARHLKISFDEEWSAYSKSVTFLDANLENPVKILLTTANMDADGTYLVSIPQTPLLTGGKFTYIIEGYADGTLQKSVSKELKVKYAPYVDAEALEGVITPTEADQLNLSIQKEVQRIDALEESKASLEESFLGLSESVEAQLLSKADASYVEDELLKKCDASYVEVELSKKCDTSYVEDALIKKCDTSYVENALLNKANASDVATELLKKADASHVAKELSKKADSTYVESALDEKADVVTVDEELSKKADKTYTENALSNKADIIYVDNISSSVSKELEDLKTEDKKHTDDISALDERLTNQEEYIKEKTDEMFDRNNVVANAIKGKASGRIIKADDVSTVEHELDVKVRSKNLIPYPYKSKGQTHGGVTYTVGEDGSITADGTATDSFFTLYGGTSGAKCPVPDWLEVGKTYTITDASLYLFKAGGGSEVFKGTFVMPDGYDYCGLLIPIVNTTVTNRVYYPQLEEGTTASEYTPYIDPSTVKVIRSGKNMLINKKGDATIRGIQWTVNEDGTINASGTIGADVSDYYFFGTTVENEDSFTAPLDLVLSTNYEIDNNNVFAARTSAGLLQATANGVVIPKGTRVDGIFLRVTNKTINQQNIECQMEIGTTKTVYEPCKWQSALADAEGNIEGVTSLAPFMILMADKENVSVDLTYNKDTNKVIERLINGIISLGGNI